MTFAYPSQKLQDWLSQGWCIATGQRFDSNEMGWLKGPFGNVDVIEDKYIALLAEREGLEVHANLPGAGIVESMLELISEPEIFAQIKPEIVDFYENTANYEFEVWTQWCQLYRPFAGMLASLYSRRLQQLNLPQRPLDTSRGIKSTIFKLIDPQTGNTRYTVWFRRLKSTGEVVYSGIYGTCKAPNGESLLKVVFPLPRGNATVVMRPEVDSEGALTLVSRGERIGDPGFYFLLVDSKDRQFVRYIPTLQETIRVFVDEENVLRADHILNLRRCTALHLHYRINPTAKPCR